MDINLTAPFCSTSYGIVALNTAHQLLKLGHKVSIFPIGNIVGQDIPPHFHESVYQGLENAKFFNPDAPSVRLFHQFDLAQHVGRGKRIGWPIFELNQFNPIELHHLLAQDELIVCSQWAKTVCEHAVNNKGPWIPIHVVPLGVDSTIFSPAQLNRSREILTPTVGAGCSFTLPYVKTIIDNNTTIFINIGKKELRKGHDIILECFQKAFGPNDNVKLLMVWANRILDEINPVESAAWEKMYNTSELHEKIVLYNNWLPSQNDVSALIKSSDCGIFISRAEGWNLDLLEVMTCGLPVITTYYSGHTEYVNDQNAYYVKGNGLETAYDGVWFHGQGEWLHIDEASKSGIVAQMQYIHQAKQRGENLFNKAGVETAKRFSWENTAKQLIKAIL